MFAGIWVVDFTIVIAGPQGTMVLADPGAEVIRVESIQETGAGGRVQRAKISREQAQLSSSRSRSYPGGDPGPRPWNRGAGFNAHARNKLCTTVDLRRPEGMEVLARLVKASDVVTENHATTALERAGYIGMDYAPHVE